jgi:hypothetical protein
MKPLQVVALALLTLPVLKIAAADRPPFYVAGGVSEFDKQIRDMTNDYPWTVGLGWGESEAAMFGAPSLDLEWAHAQGHGNKFDSYGVTYNERALITDSLYFGVGIGSYYNRIDATDKNGKVYDASKWFPAARGLIGLNLGGGRYGSLFTELAYTYRGKVDGLDANSFSLVLGFWF